MITLKDAIYLEKIDEVKRILEENPPLIDEVDEDGVLMALLAAKTGNLNLVRYIVEYSRASMNITDKNQKNMLHYAAMSGNVATCKYLVERVGLSISGGFSSKIRFTSSIFSKYMASLSVIIFPPVLPFKKHLFKSFSSIHDLFVFFYILKQNIVKTYRKSVQSEYL